MNRRRLVLSAIGAGLAVSGISAGSALAATDDELAYANFGLATEFLLKDFYANAAATKVFKGQAAREILRGGFNAAEHAGALGKLLTEAGQQAAVEADFEFAWPDGAFDSRASITKAGLLITENLAGVYITAATVVSIASYRRLYASMTANLAQQVAFLSDTAGSRAIGISFAPAVEIEAASDAIEAYLG